MRISNINITAVVIFVSVVFALVYITIMVIICTRSEHTPPHVIGTYSFITISFIIIRDCTVI